MIRRDFWQTNFRGSIGLPVIRILFYYAPFKLVESKKALGSIQEGVFFVDTTGKQDFDKAITLLQKGKNIGIADQHTIMGLRDLSKWHLRAALHDFKQALEANPNSATSHYNIGLIYAQLEDYHSASFHFKKAYYLDNGNVLGGSFCRLSSQACL
ncbi:PUTATIVE TRANSMEMBRANE PROTEIN [Helicobacter bizzozeronii CCUG 35545]|nr:PUTATIVE TRANSMEMBRANE PROTEIN [Helicobacter bizzozeronii CCUG 35545]